VLPRHAYIHVVSIHPCLNVHGSILESQSLFGVRMSEIGQRGSIMLCGWMYPPRAFCWLLLPKFPLPFAFSCRVVFVYGCTAIPTYPPAYLPTYLPTCLPDSLPTLLFWLGVDVLSWVGVELGSSAMSRLGRDWTGLDWTGQGRKDGRKDLFYCQWSILSDTPSHFSRKPSFHTCFSFLHVGSLPYYF
jgi:hypothetical protein